MVEGDVWYVLLIRKKNETAEEMDSNVHIIIYSNAIDIIPLEISRIDQFKVYTLQVICYTIAKALYTV